MATQVSAGPSISKNPLVAEVVVLVLVTVNSVVVVAVRVWGATSERNGQIHDDGVISAARLTVVSSVDVA